MTAATFRPHERISSPIEFRRAFDRRRSASDDSLIVYGAENGLAYPRLGISVGRKRVRKATDRNRVKRLIREAFRLNKEVLPEGVDLVIVPRGPALTFEQANRSLPQLAAAVAARLARDRGRSRPRDRGHDRQPSSETSS
ncbi:ribonuclease P protein component [Tautonia sp. JC769]|uniref:ribonuclease P protein component n=1 Tax=Tautonia sp. JC769 TaxID=3232135 RepID=UPI0034590BC2